MILWVFCQFLWLYTEGGLDEGNFQNFPHLSLMQQLPTSLYRLIPNS